MRKIRFAIIFFFLSSAAFAQQNVDSTAVPQPSDISMDSTAAADTTSPGSIAAPLFDFRKQPDVWLHGLYYDSTLIIGSRYTSFGDVLDWFPGGYHFNLGGAGQQAFGAMFGGPRSGFVLEYDGLILNNPITGTADLNLIPTESLGHAGIVHSAFKAYDNLPIGAALQFESRSIADNPIRSQVGYRTGYYGYDDVDVRVGILPSSKWWLDLGGVIKNYAGVIPNEEYSGQKINVKVNRRFGANWLARYVLLFNLRDAEIPLPGQLQNFQEFYDPRQKERRTDHALQLFHKDNFKTTLQLTKFEQDLRAANRGIFDERHDVYSIRLTGEFAAPLWRARWRSGVAGHASWLTSNAWDDKRDWQTEAYTSLSGRLAQKLCWYAGARLQKNEAFNPQWTPEANLFYAADSTMRFSLWANKINVYPSMQARYADGPFALGSPNLDFATYSQIGLAAEKGYDDLFLHGSLALQHRQKQIAIQYDGESIRYANMPRQTVLNAGALVDYRFLKDWRLVFKGEYFHSLEAEPRIVNRPDFYFKSFLQYHLVKFQGDLNARLRIGALALGERRGPVPFYVDYSPTTASLGPAVYPYLHAVLLYRSAEIFIAYENFIDADVQFVYGYSMPSLWFRYGFIWHFVD